MKTKIEITDAMVERAMQSTLADMPLRAPDKVSQGYLRDSLRKAIDAAMNPAEPEITVTDAMMAAGHSAYFKRPGSPNQWDCLCDAYRAMRALEPAPADPNEKLYPVSWFVNDPAGFIGGSLAGIRETVREAHKTGADSAQPLMRRAPCCDALRSGPCSFGDACCMHIQPINTDPDRITPERLTAETEKYLKVLEARRHEEARTRAAATAADKRRRFYRENQPDQAGAFLDQREGKERRVAGSDAPRQFDPHWRSHSVVEAADQVVVTPEMHNAAMAEMDVSAKALAAGGQPLSELQLAAMRCVIHPLYRAMRVERARADDDGHGAGEAEGGAMTRQKSDRKALTRAIERALAAMERALAVLAEPDPLSPEGVTRATLASMKTSNAICRRVRAVTRKRRVKRRARK